MNVTVNTMIWNMHVAISMDCRPPARFHLSQTSCLSESVVSMILIYKNLGMMTSMSTC